MAVPNIFTVGLNKTNKQTKNKHKNRSEREKPCRSTMFVLRFINLALRAASHIYCVFATDEAVLGSDLIKSVAYLKCAADRSISH